MIGFIEALALAALLVAALVWLAMAMSSPKHLGDAATPGTRALRARLWLYGTWWVPALVVSAAVAPGLLGALFGAEDHCTLHAGHGHHLCVLHPPHISNTPLVWLLLLSLGGITASFVTRSVRVLWQEMRLIKTLARSGRPTPLGEDVLVLEQDEPIALTVGILRPIILLSTGLIEAVSPQTLRVVLAHERAHVRRRDTAWSLLDRFACWFVPRKVGTFARHELSLACEQSCDGHAAQAAGHLGNLHVAAALVEVAKLGLSEPAPGMSMGASSLEQRVGHLLNPPIPSRGYPASVLFGCLVLLGLGAGPFHDLVEYIITFLLH